MLSATASTTAPPGVTSCWSISWPKTKWKSTRVWRPATTVVNSSGSSKVFAFSYAGGASVSITVADGATLTDLAELINNSGANPGVTATVLDMGEAYTTDRYRLMLTGNDTGSANDIAIRRRPHHPGRHRRHGGFHQRRVYRNPIGPKRPGAPGRLPPSGWIERAANTFSDVLSGVTLSLLSTSATAVQVTVTNDTAAMQEEILGAGGLL
jgi:flagellar capping protein FliD